MAPKQPKNLPAISIESNKSQQEGLNYAGLNLLDYNTSALKKLSNLLLLFTMRQHRNNENNQELAETFQKVVQDLKNLLAQAAAERRKTALRLFKMGLHSLLDSNSTLAALIAMIESHANFYQNIENVINNIEQSLNASQETYINRNRYLNKFQIIISLLSLVKNSLRDKSLSVPQANKTETTALKTARANAQNILYTLIDQMQFTLNNITDSQRQFAFDPLTESNSVILAPQQGQLEFLYELIILYTEQINQCFDPSIGTNYGNHFIENFSHNILELSNVVNTYQLTFSELVITLKKLNEAVFTGTCVSPDTAVLASSIQKQLDSVINLQAQDVDELIIEESLIEQLKKSLLTECQKRLDNPDLVRELFHKALKKLVDSFLPAISPLLFYFKSADLHQVQLERIAETLPSDEKINTAEWMKIWEVGNEITDLVINALHKIPNLMTKKEADLENEDDLGLHPEGRVRDCIRAVVQLTLILANKRPLPNRIPLDKQEPPLSERLEAQSLQIAHVFLATILENIVNNDNLISAPQDLVEVEDFFFPEVLGKIDYPVEEGVELFRALWEGQAKMDKIKQDTFKKIVTDVLKQLLPTVFPVVEKTYKYAKIAKQQYDNHQQEAVLQEKCDEWTALLDEEYFQEKFQEEPFRSYLEYCSPQAEKDFWEFLRNKRDHLLKQALTGFITKLPQNLRSDQAIIDPTSPVIDIFASFVDRYKKSFTTQIARQLTESLEQIMKKYIGLTSHKIAQNQ